MHSMYRSLAAKRRSASRGGTAPKGRVLPRLRSLGVWLSAAIVLLVSGTALGEPQFVRTPANAKPPKEVEGIAIEPRPGATLARTLAFTDQNGRAVTMGDYLDGKKPLIVVLAYYQCPMLCSQVLSRLLDATRPLAWGIGREFRVVTVSFDPRDDAASAAAKRQAYVDAYQRPVPVEERGWDFLVGDRATVRQLADTLGFRYRWDPQHQQFAHAAGVFVITPDGRLSQTLYGLTYSTQAVRLALTAASQGKLGTIWDQVLLLCYHYDPNSGSYTLAVMKLVRLTGTVFALALALFLVRLWRKERRARDLAATHPEQVIP
jgi:protein SCO1